MTKMKYYAAKVGHYVRPDSAPKLQTARSGAEEKKKHRGRF